MANYIASYLITITVANMDFTLHVHTDTTNLQDLGTCIYNYIVHNNYLQTKKQITSYNLHNYLIKLIMNDSTKRN